MPECRWENGFKSASCKLKNVNQKVIKNDEKRLKTHIFIEKKLEKFFKNY